MFLVAYVSLIPSSLFRRIEREREIVLTFIVVDRQLDTRLRLLRVKN